MLFGSQQVMCVGKPEPRQWEYSGRSGISYKVSVSDGTSNLELPVASAEVWNKFVPFKMFTVTVEVSQTATDNRIATRTRIVDAAEVK